jgi:hypothetical protein
VQIKLTIALGVIVKQQVGKAILELTMLWIGLPELSGND